jgi:hypothetical protein
MVAVAGGIGTISSLSPSPIPNSTKSVSDATLLAMKLTKTNGADPPGMQSCAESSRNFALRRRLSRHSPPLRGGGDGGKRLGKSTVGESWRQLGDWRPFVR